MAAQQHGAYGKTPQRGPETKNGAAGSTSSESLLHESEKRRLLALEATSDGVWEWDIKTGKIITSPSYFTMLGCTTTVSAGSYPEFVTSYDEFIDMLHQDDKEAVDKGLHECIAGHKSNCEIELRMRTESGGWKWILKRGKVVEWDEQGNPTRMIGTHIDINESKLDKDELRRAQERSRALYMGTPLPTYTWQKAGGEIILADYNTAAIAFTNGKISDFVGKKACVLYEENRGIYDTILKAYLNRTNYKFETIYHMFTIKDDRYINMTCAFVAPDMVIVHMEDITKQKLAEQKLQGSEKNLRQLTEQLFKAEETMSKQVVQELHDSIGQYLTSIKYIAEKAESQIHSGELEEGSASLDTMVSIIQTTIDEVSRISMGLRPSTLDDLGILATVSWFCREYQTVYPDIRLEKKLEAEESDVPPAVKTPLFRILQEALNNVARHSKATKVTVALLKTGERIELSIADNGQGFLPHQKTPGNPDGRVGFGLISMQERAKYSDGVCTIESSSKKGTVVRASWPCNQVNAD